MSSAAPNRTAICLTGSRSLNKRMSLFIEGVLELGASVSVLALPRGKWSTQRFESSGISAVPGRLTLQINSQSSAQPGVVLCFHWLMLPLAVFFGWWHRIPVIYDEHDHYELNTLEGSSSYLRQKLGQLMIRCLHRMCLPHVSLITCIHLANSELKRHLEQWQPNVLELHNYPVAAWTEAAPGYRAEDPLCFVYMGGVFEEKGVGQAADAFERLPATIRRTCELHVFGAGDAALLNRLSGRERVVVHNSQSPEQLRRFAAAHRCCGLVLYNEHPRYRLIGTNSRKLWEYLALGMPVIATSVGELPRFLIEHQTGILIHAKIEIDELSAAMHQMAEEHGNWNLYSQHARSLMNRSDMSWEHEWQKVVRSGYLDQLRNISPGHSPLQKAA